MWTSSHTEPCGALAESCGFARFFSGQLPVHLQKSHGELQVLSFSQPGGAVTSSEHWSDVDPGAAVPTSGVASLLDLELLTLESF